MSTRGCKNARRTLLYFYSSNMKTESMTARTHKRHVSLSYISWMYCQVLHNEGTVPLFHKNSRVCLEGNVTVLLFEPQL